MIEIMENDLTSVFSNEIFEIEDVYPGYGVAVNLQMEVETRKDIYYPLETIALKKAIKSIKQVKTSFKGF